MDQEEVQTPAEPDRSTWRKVRSVGRRKSTRVNDNVVGLQIDTKLHQSLREKAARRGLVLSSLVRMAITELLEQLPEEPTYIRTTPAESPRRRHTCVLTIWLPLDVKERLYIAARRRNMYVSEFVRAVCAEVDLQLPLERQ